MAEPTTSDKESAPAPAPPQAANGNGFYGAAQHLARSPLGIIALFIVLVYSIAGITAAARGDDIPVLIQYFLIGFPVLVLLVFTYLVVKHREKLYAPGDFSDQKHFMELFGNKARAIHDFQGETPSAETVVQRAMAGRTGRGTQPMLLPWSMQAWMQAMGPTSGSSSFDPPGFPAPNAVPPQPAQQGHSNDVEVDSMVDPTDPHKGRFGGKSQDNGWRLSVQGNTVKHSAKDRDLFELTLLVDSVDPMQQLNAPVRLFLHPTFRRPEISVRPIDGRVTMPILCYGSFTVGAVLPDGTRLELDLSSDSIRSPREFRER